MSSISLFANSRHLERLGKITSSRFVYSFFRLSSILAYTHLLSRYRLLCSNIFFPDLIFSYTSGLKLKSIFLTYSTALIPPAFYIENFHRHTDKLDIKLKTWLNLCTCIVNSETKLPTIIKIHFNCVITIRLEL